MQQVKNPRPLGGGFLLPVFLIISAVFALYSISLSHNFLFDEENIILFNPAIKNLSEWPGLFQRGYFSALSPGEDLLWVQYYRPLTLVTFALNYAVLGVNPLIYNLTNTLLHALVCVLLYLLLRRLSANSWAALLGAILYSVHTIHTEAVTYTASRSDLLAAIWMLSALLLYLSGRYAWVWVCYVLAMLSKESGLLLPIYLVLFDLCFIRSRFLKLSFRFLPFLAAGISYVIFRKYFSPIPLMPATTDVHASFLRVLSMGSGFLGYLQALVFPESFKYCDSIPFAQSFLDAKVGITLLIAVLFLFALLISWKYRGAAFFGLSFFVLGLAPNCQWVRIMPDWAEHYLYVPSIGLVILLSAFFKRILETPNKLWRTIFFVVYIPFISFLSWRTFERNMLYVDDHVFYTRLGRSGSPYAHFGYTSIASALTREGRWSEAGVYITAVHRMHPDSELNTYNMGLYYAKQNRNEDAIHYFKEAYRLAPNQPAYLLQAVILLHQLGRYPEALEEIRRLESQMADEWVFYKHLSRIYEFSGDPQTALHFLKTGLNHIKPEPHQQAPLLMEIVLLAFRQDWSDVLNHYLNELWPRFKDLPWYGEAGMLLKGEISPQEYERVIETRYGKAVNETWPYLLAAYTLRNEKEKLDLFFKTDAVKIESRTQDKLFVKKFFERALRS